MINDFYDHHTVNADCLRLRLESFPRNKSAKYYTFIIIYEKRKELSGSEIYCPLPIKAVAAPGVLEFEMMNNGWMSENAVIQTKRPSDGNNAIL